jgi:RNA polymerase sigma-70 factor (ECF subfamily)
MPPPDSQLTRWFAEEVQPHEAALRGWLRSRFSSLVDLDDLVQEAYSRLLRVRQTGSIANARAFLFVTARNLALNHLRHARHTPFHSGADTDTSGVLDESVAVPENVARAEDLQHLIHAIQALPERCRQVLTLRKIYGLSQQETADRLGIAVHTVEAQGAIGLRKCIEYFRRHGYSTRP